MERAKRDEKQSAKVLCFCGDRSAHRVLPCGVGEDSSATFVNEVDHVGITESGQAEQKGHVILLNDPLDEALPAPVVRVILVHEKTTVEIDEEDGILEIIRDTHNLDSV